MIKITGIGADPELFVTKGDKVVSAIGLVGGTKKVPVAMADGYFVQEDNVLAEFNIPPGATEVEFADNIRTGLNLLNVRLSPKYGVLVKAFHVMDKKELKHPKAKEFGCDPDIFAWDNVEHVANPPLDGLRTSSGHFHFGYEGPTHAKNIQLAKAFDIFHGLPSVILDPDNRRRELYGQAGAFRHKPYGLEYRTLSSFWIQDEILCRWVFRNAEKAAAWVEEGGLASVSEIDGHDIKTAINFYDKTLAQMLIAKYNVPMP